MGKPGGETGARAAGAGAAAAGGTSAKGCRPPLRRRVVRSMDSRVTSSPAQLTAPIGSGRVNPSASATSTASSRPRPTFSLRPQSLSGLANRYVFPREVSKPGRGSPFSSKNSARLPSAP
eukprot:11530490-Alexandrium_andersonii.AAC.1